MVLGDLIHFFPSRLPYPRTWLSSIVVVYRGLLNSVFFSLFPFLSNPVIVVLVAVHTSIVFFSICTFPSVCRCVSVLCVYNVLYLFLFTLHRLAAVLIFFSIYSSLSLSLSLLLLEYSRTSSLSLFCSFITLPYHHHSLRRLNQVSPGSIPFLPFLLSCPCPKSFLLLCFRPFYYKRLLSLRFLSLSIVNC